MREWRACYSVVDFRVFSNIVIYMCTMERRSYFNINNFATEGNNRILPPCYLSSSLEYPTQAPCKCILCTQGKPACLRVQDPSWYVCWSLAAVNAKFSLQDNNCMGYFVRPSLPQSWSPLLPLEIVCLSLRSCSLVRLGAAQQKWVFSIVCNHSDLTLFLYINRHSTLEEANIRRSQSWNQVVCYRPVHFLQKW